MDFFDRQEAARKVSKRLVVYFALAVLGVSLAVGAVVAGAGAMGSNKINAEITDGSRRIDLKTPLLFFGTSGATMLVILLGSLFKTVALSAGGPAVAKSLGGRKVDPNTTDADERKLLNVVEEMSIASGIPVPDVYMMDAEHGINAFAAGRTTSDAVIGATRGCVKMLTRDELQGVVAHEFSHILNGDMRLNLRLMGLLFGIIMITVMGRIILRSVWYSGGSRRNSKDGGGVIAILAFGVALTVIGYIGVLMANMIKAAVSRQREFLADASAVQFTRNPDGIAGALKKIGGLSNGSHLGDAHAEEASHMFFASGLKAGLTNALSTHPPLPDRIKAIDPSWNGKFPRVALPQVSSSISSGANEMASAASGLADLANTVTGAGGRSSGASHAQGGIPIDSIIGAAAMAATATTGAPNEEQVSYAQKLHKSLPESWRAAARNEAGAQALVFAMLLAQDDDLRGSELGMLERELDGSAYKTVMALYGDLGDLASARKIALIDLAIPTLRRLSPDEYDRFRAIMRHLIESDGRVDLFEFMLEKIVRRHLDIAFNRTSAPKVRHRNLAPLADDAAVLVSTLARLGLESAEEATLSFDAGANALAQEVGGKLSMLSPAECSLERIEAALGKFECAIAPVKRSLLLACGKAVMHDDIVANDEAELIRAIADAIDAPIPPFVMKAA